jgi:HPt (histidine-containing phosphotransfer) domain-containing protein
MKPIEASRPPPAAFNVSDVLYPLTLQKLHKIVGENNDVFTELIDMFLEDAPTLLENMRQAVIQGAAEDLRFAAHSLKSSSAEFGATALCELCRELEAMGKENTLVGAAEKVSQAEALYERVQAALIDIREALAAKPGK